jgi:predicted nucleic acid-binding protein
MKSLFSSNRPIVFDSEGLSRAIRRDPYIITVIHDAFNERSPVLVPAVTLVEAISPRTRPRNLDWVLSQLTVVPITEHIARVATRLLMETRQHGHTHAIDALVAATALSLPGEPFIFTSDPQDMEILVDNAATIVALH